MLSGGGKCSINIEFGKKNNLTSKFKRKSVEVDLDKESHIKIEVKKARHPKCFRITIYNLETKNPVFIKNIQIKNGEYIPDLTKFEIDEALYKIKENGFIFYPKKRRIILTYYNISDLNAPIDFEWELFIIISILSFLFAYKLTDYLADFKTLKGNSVIDIVFLFIFFIFLFIPMSYINNNDISKSENRYLSTKKPLYTEENGINYNWGKEVSAWFDDRFNFRKDFITVYGLKNLINKNWRTKTVIKGKDGWIFYGTPNAIATYINKVMFTKSELEEITNYLKEIDSYCRKYGKHFYFVIPPDKPKIYGELYSSVIKQVNNNSKSRANQLVKYIKEHSQVKVIYLQDALLPNKDKGMLYYKHDTHWNMLGAYYGYLEIMKLISGDLKNLSIYQIKRYKTEEYLGDLNKQLPANLQFKKSAIYKIPDLYDKKAICNDEISSGIILLDNCKNITQEKNLVLYGDSFSIALAPYLAESFKESEFIRGSKPVPFGMNNADVVIFEVLERNLPSLSKDFKENE